MKTVKHLAGLVALVFLISCGGGGGGGGGGSSSNYAPSSKDLLGDFILNYTVGVVYEDRYIIDTLYTTQSSEGTDRYTGRNSKYPSLLALGEWLPSKSQYLLVASTALAGDYYVYAFTIAGGDPNDGNAHPVSGCFYLMVNSALSSCYPINPGSGKFAPGKWARTMNQKTGDENIALKIQEAGAVNSSHQEDVELQAKVAELKSALDSLGK